MMDGKIHQDAEKVSFSMRIEAACSELKLSTLASMVEDICEQATRRQQSTLEVLALLLETEVEDRQGRRISRRLKEAGFPRIKTLAEFSFERAPHVPQAIITELFSGAYIQRAQGVILIGDPGTGKTHLATALGVAACNQGRSTRFVSAANLVNDLVEAKDARILGSTVRRYARCELLVIDDLGYLPLVSLTTPFGPI